MIVKGVDALPVEHRRDAENHLIGLAAEHDPVALRRIAHHVLEVVAPEIAEEHQLKALQRQEALAEEACRFTIADDGHGLCHGRFTLPAPVGAMLKQAVLAINSPKHRRHSGTPKGLGHAFCEYVTRYPIDRLPQAGGVDATIVVTMTLENLLGDSQAPALLDTGDPITADQARKLAREAWDHPMVLAVGSRRSSTSRPPQTAGRRVRADRDPAPRPAPHSRRLRRARSDCATSTTTCPGAGAGRRTSATDAVPCPRHHETCSCELMCPCNTSLDHGATYDFCRVTLVFNILQGAVESTDIAGRKVALIADTPKVMTDGNWRVGVFIDDGATDAQFDQLIKVFSGQLGGPMAGLAPLIGEMLGVERAAIEVDDDGLRHERCPHRRGHRLRDRGHRAVRGGVRPAGEVLGDVPPGRFRSDDGRGQAVENAAPSASSTKERADCRSRTSRGPPEGMSDTGSAASSADERPSRRRSRPAAPSGGSSSPSSPSPAAAWWWTAEQHARYGRGALDRPRHVRPGSSASGVVMMMAAMMFPSVAPTVALFCAAERGVVG